MNSFRKLSLYVYPNNPFRRSRIISKWNTSWQFRRRDDGVYFTINPDMHPEVRVGGGNKLILKMVKLL